MRAVIEPALRAVCAARGWGLVELNVRTEHIHAVVSGTVKPETILTSLKAAATRELRRAGLVQPEQTVWARHGSTRYLWSEEDVSAARDYVLNHQGADLPGSQWRKWRDVGAD